MLSDIILVGSGFVCGLVVAIIGFGYWLVRSHQYHR